VTSFASRARSAREPSSLRSDAIAVLAVASSLAVAPFWFRDVRTLGHNATASRALAVAAEPVFSPSAIASAASSTFNRRVKSLCASFVSVLPSVAASASCVAKVDIALPSNGWAKATPAIAGEPPKAKHVDRTAAPAVAAARRERIFWVIMRKSYAADVTGT